MPTNQDETLQQRCARDHQDYLRTCGGMTAEQVANLQLQLNNALAREAALREELESLKDRRCAARLEKDELRKRLTIAEQRNAELVELLNGVLPILKMIKGDGLHIFLNSSERVALEAALKPAESGASE